MVGNKIDLRDNEEAIQKMRDKDLAMITTAQGVELARELKAVAYHETSSLTSVGLKEFFNTVILAGLGELAADGPKLFGEGEGKGKKEKCIMM